GPLQLLHPVYSAAQLLPEEQKAPERQPQQQNSQVSAGFPDIQHPAAPHSSQKQQNIQNPCGFLHVIKLNGEQTSKSCLLLSDTRQKFSLSARHRSVKRPSEFPFPVPFH